MKRAGKRKRVARKATKPQQASKKAKRCMRKLVKVVLVVAVNLLVFVVLLYCVECYFWLTDPQRKLPPKRVYKNGTEYTWGHPIYRNSYGFRERDFAVPKAKGTKRVMILGDSLSWGVGVPDRKRYSNILQDKLKPFSIEVLNLALPGGSPQHYRSTLLSMGKAVQPDLILVGFCLNDPQTKTMRWSAEWEEWDRRYRRTLDKLKSGCASVGLKRLGQRLDKTICRLAEVFGAYPHWTEALDRCYDVNSREWHDYIKALTDIKHISDDMNLPPPIFAVLNQAVYNDKPTDYGNPDKVLRIYLKWYHQAEKSSAELGYKTVSFENEIARELSDVPLGVNALDGHPCEQLHEVYASKLFEVLLEVLGKSSEHDN